MLSARFPPEIPGRTRHSAGQGVRGIPTRCLAFARHDKGARALVPASVSFRAAARNLARTATTIADKWSELLGQDSRVFPLNAWCGGLGGRSPRGLRSQAGAWERDDGDGGKGANSRMPNPWRGSWHSWWHSWRAMGVRASGIYGCGETLGVGATARPICGTLEGRGVNQLGG